MSVGNWFCAECRAWGDTQSCEIFFQIHFTCSHKWRWRATIWGTSGMHRVSSRKFSRKIRKFFTVLCQISCFTDLKHEGHRNCKEFVREDHDWPSPNFIQYNSIKYSYNFGILLSGDRQDLGIARILWQYSRKYSHVKSRHALVIWLTNFDAFAHLGIPDFSENLIATFFSRLRRIASARLS